MAAILLAAPLLLREAATPEEVVSLTALRGGSAQAVPAADSHHILRLRLDTTDLVEPLEGQVVDGSGGQIRSQPISASNSEIKLEQRLNPGNYWVRINSSAGDHRTLREFSLKVR